MKCEAAQNTKSTVVLVRTAGGALASLSMRHCRRLCVLLLLAVHTEASADQPLKSWQVSIDGDVRGGFVSEAWGTSKVDYLEDRDSTGVFTGVKIKGNNRLFVVSDYVWAHTWRDVSAVSKRRSRPCMILHEN